MLVDHIAQLARQLGHDLIAELGAFGFCEGGDGMLFGGGGFQEVDLKGLELGLEVGLKGKLAVESALRAV